MAGVIRKYPGLELLAEATMLAAFVDLGAGTGSAVAPGAPLATSDVKPVRRAAAKGPYYCAAW
jgi:hypothetical protein